MNISASGSTGYEVTSATISDNDTVTAGLPAAPTDSMVTTSDDSTTTTTVFITLTSDLPTPTGPIGVLPTIPADADPSFLENTVNQLLGIIQRLMDILGSKSPSSSTDGTGTSDSESQPEEGADNPSGPVITNPLTLPDSGEPSTTVITPTDTDTAFPFLNGSPYPPVTIVLPPQRQNPEVIPANASMDAISVTPPTITGDSPALTPATDLPPKPTYTLPISLSAPPSASFTPLLTAASGTAPSAWPSASSSFVSLALPSQPPVPTETPPAPSADAGAAAAKQWARQVWLAIVELLKDLLGGSGPGTEDGKKKGEIRRRGVAGRAMSDAVWKGPGAGRWG